MTISLSLANKYRPQTFDQMIGQQHIIGILKAKMQSDRESLQNYLLTGPRGTGKTSSARILAKAINCLNPHEGNPCNACTNCDIINAGTSLDYVEIDAASHTGVDNIREEILDKALYPPTALKKKIYVIDEVHMLSKGAFNSLLKTIEEPKGNVCFILATTEIHKVPDTIISRCQVFNFKKVADEEITSNLIHICEQEGFSYEKEALALIATISDGGVRDSVKYLDQVSILGTITQENVSKFLGISSEASIKEFLQQLKTRNKHQMFTAIDQLTAHGIDLYQFTKQVLGFIDTHFLEDVEFYLQVSEVFGEILRQIRYYPYPALVYKLAMHTYMEPQATVSQQAEISVPKVNVSAPEATISAPEASVSSPETTIPASTTTISEPKTDGTTQDIQDIQTLWNGILSQLSKPTLQSNLKDYVMVERVENDVMHLVVISKIAETLLQNADNKKEIETQLSLARGAPTMIEFVFESKETYFARKLEQ